MDDSIRQHKYVLSEDQMPTTWYNLMADLPVPPPPPNLRPRPVVPITEATVADLVQKGRRKFDECLGSYHLLRLVVTSSAKRADGRATLTEVDGMPFAASVPDHDCLRKGLRRLSFPRPSKPTEFVVPLDLRPAEGTPG